MTYSNTLPIYHVAFSEFNQKNFINIYDILCLVKKGIVTKETYVWKKGMSQWIKAGKVHDLKPLFAMPPNVPASLKEDCQLFDENEFIN